MTAQNLTVDNIEAAKKALTDNYAPWETEFKYFQNPAELAFWKKHNWIDYLPDGRMFSTCPFLPMHFEIVPLEMKIPTH